MRAHDTFKTKEAEFNRLIRDYELDPTDIAKYLLIIRETNLERKKLVHELLGNYEYANAIIHITELLLKVKEHKTN